MLSLGSICRFCLVNAENDTDKSLIKLTEVQKTKFEELTNLQLPMSNEYPTNVCIDCSDYLENFYFFKCQLVRKQNDLNMLLNSIKNQEGHEILHETAIHDNFIEFNEEIEIFDEGNVLLDSQDYIEETAEDETLSGKASDTNQIIYREELKYEKPNPQLVLFPNDIKNSDSEAPTIIEEKDIFKCKLCDLNLNSKLSLESHMKDHHTESFICPHCGNIYHSKKDLRSHLRSHNFNKKYKCTFSSDCTKAFRHQHHLINHLRVHTKKSPFVCNECSKTFRQKYALTLHMKKHTKDFIECSRCKSQFIRPIQLKKHIENNLCDGTFRPYVTRNKKP